MENFASFVNLKAVFLSRAKKYLYVVICPSNVTYNHLSMRKNKRLRIEPRYMVPNSLILILKLIVGT